LNPLGMSDANLPIVLAVMEQFAREIEELGQAYLSVTRTTQIPHILSVNRTQAASMASRRLRGQTIAWPYEHTCSIVAFLDVIYY
jgi:hypothetical protein